MTLRFPDPQQVDRVGMQEDIRQGERVREYTMAGLVGGEWVELAEGSCIGHKRIEPVEISGLRLQVTRSADTPVIRRLAAYDTSRTGRGSGVRP